jgi:hypothetical protein
MLEPVRAPLGIEVVHGVLEAGAPYVPAVTVPVDTTLEPIVDVAARDGAAGRGDVFLRAPNGLSSAGLSLAALRDHRAAEPYRWLVLAQSDPDRVAGVPPLARLHEEADASFEEHFGLTHLGANAAVDALAVFTWLLAPGEQALLVLTDQRLLPPSEQTGERLPAGDSSIALRVVRGPAPLGLVATGNTSWERDAFASGKTFRARLRRDLESMLRTEHAWSADHVVVQNLFAETAGQPFRGSGLDFGSGDVWHRVRELLRTRWAAAGERVLIVATGGVRRVSYALLEIGDGVEGVR